jgi:hypothetical protein
MKNQENRFTNRNNNSLIKDTRDRISFFENVFYWIYLFFTKIRDPNGRPASHAACILVSIIKELNVVFLALLILSIVGNHILSLDTWMKMLCFLFVIFFFIDGRLYIKRFDKIIGKFEFLSVKKNEKRKELF